MARKEHGMKAKRTKYKRATPKTTVEYSTWDIDVGLSLDVLFRGIAEFIRWVFGILYMNRSSYVFI